MRQNLQRDAPVKMAVTASGSSNNSIRFSWEVRIIPRDPHSMSRRLSGTLHYDTILKSILQSLGNILTPSLTGGAKPVELLNVEFNSMEKRVPDLVARLDDGRIFHLEVQSDNDRKMPLRMLRYWLLLREQYPGALIVQHVLYIGGPTLSMKRYIEEGDVSYRYGITDIRDIDEEVFLRSDLAAD